MRQDRAQQLENKFMGCQVPTSTTMKFKAELALVCIIDVIVDIFSVRLMPQRYYHHETVKEINIILNRDGLSRVKDSHGLLE